MNWFYKKCVGCDKQLFIHNTCKKCENIYKVKAKEIVRIVQGTMRLENQGLTSNQLKILMQRTIQDLKETYRSAELE